MYRESDPNRRRKIAILIHLAPTKLGSLEDWLIRFAARLSNDYEVAVATYSKCHPIVRDQLQQCGASWHDLDELEHDLIKARAWFQEYAEIAHFSLFAPRAPIVVVASTTLEVAGLIFQDCHSTAELGAKASLLSRGLDRITFIRTDVVVAVSDFVSSRLSLRFGIRSPKLRTVYNGVDVSRFTISSLPSSGRLIVCVAALIKEKGVDYLIHALAAPMLSSERLIIVGDGPERASLETLAYRLGVGERVEFLGLRDDVHAIVGNAAVVVHPAVWGEAFGLTIAEAMAAGRPVVGCQVGAVPELIQDGETGFVVPPGDPRALVEALATLLADGDLRDRMGARARERAEEFFSMDQWVSSHVDIVKQVHRARLPR